MSEAAPAGRWDSAMDRAIEAASAVRHLTSPNPWVGAVLVASDGRAYNGATSPPGGPHAERHALASAGAAAKGATLVTTPRAVRPPRPHRAVRRVDHRRGREPGW